MKTYMPGASALEKKWYVVDATDMTLGRLASEVAKVLTGKNKPIYTPNIDTGDYVIVINAEKVKVTGKKLDQKGSLGADQYKKLHVYVGPDHEQTAQKPETLTF